MASVGSKVLNIGQKTFVVGALGMVGYHCFQIANNVRLGVKHETQDSTYFEDVQKTVDKE